MSKIKLFPFIILSFVFSGCQPARNHELEVYLLTEELPASELAHVDLNQLEIAEKPILSIDDIVSYDKASHTVELTQDAIERIQALFSTPVNLSGIPFVVCVGDERIYTGAFWTPLSSRSYDGVVIMQPFGTTTIQITLGYPGPDFFTGSDPRADPRIMNALEKANKLK